MPISKGSYWLCGCIQHEDSSLSPEALKDPLGCMPLLGGNSPILLQYLPDPRQKRPQPGTGPPLVQLVTRRFAQGENLLEGLPVHPRLGQDLPLAYALNQHPLPDCGPHFHVSRHLALLLGAALFNRRSTAANFNRRLQACA